MRKTLNERNGFERNGLRILAAVALTGSLAAFGCTTNRTPGYGEPGMSAPAAGVVAPNATSTPGSANTMGSMPNGPVPQAMISSSPANGESASVDAIADLKADEAFRGKVLGPAAPGDNSVTPISMQQTTGQFISPSIYANPQVTVNSSISSAPTPAIVSGAGGDTGLGVVAVPATTGAATLGAIAVPTAAAINGVQNVGVTGVSSVTATPITNGTTANVALTPSGTATMANPALATNNQVIGTGMANAPAPASNVVATPILTTVGPVGQVNAGVAATAAGGSVLGVTNVTTVPAAATPTVSTASGAMTVPATPVNPAIATVPTTMPTVSAANLPASTALRTRAVRVGSSATTTTATGANGSLRVVTGANGAVVVTNQSQSVLQRFMSTLGFHRNVTAGATNNNQ